MPRFFTFGHMLGAGLVAAVLLGATAQATHEVDHRFTMWGEVRYEDGTPVAGEIITLSVEDGVPIGTVETSENGRYRVMLHVHDDDAGKIFDMTIRGVTTNVKIEFDPEDKKSERGKRLDFTIQK